MIQWVVADKEEESSDIVTANIRDLNFSPVFAVVLTLHGLVTFQDCSFSFKVEFFLDIRRRNKEPEPTVETVRTFYSHADQHRVVFKRSNFLGQDGYRPFIVNLQPTSREISMSNCTLNVSSIYIRAHRGYKADNSSAITVANIKLENCILYKGIGFHILYTEPRSYIFVQLLNLEMNMFSLLKYIGEGTIGFHVENCSWSPGYGKFMYLDKIAYVSITNCYMKVEDKVGCDNCAVIDILSLPWRSIDESAQFLFNVAVDMTVTTFYMQGVVFEGNGSPINKPYFDFDSKGVLRDSTFRVKDSLTIHTTMLIVHNILITCPMSYHPERFAVNRIVSYTCKPVCEVDKYTLQHGSMIINETSRMISMGTIDKHITKRKDFYLSVNNIDPTCSLCPLGAKCGNTNEALPGYWGYMKVDFIAMIRCPDGYCCTNNETCRGIDSCNVGRTRTLCGICEHNFTESMFSSECLPTESCQTRLYIGLYFLSAFGYAVALLLLRSFKTKLFDLIKRICQILKSGLVKITKRKVPSQANESEEMQTQETQDTSVMKYMQILLYFVQDAFIIRVQIPGEQSEISIHKILQFSPQVLTLYTSASHLCATYTTPTIKVLWQSAFGFCIMVTLLLICLVQNFASCVTSRRALHCRKLNAKLVQAFLLTVLFSYQKLVIGAFSLIQCVDVDQQRVLYIQGDIKCYTWWQIVTKVFIFIYIIPLLFVLSQAPFLVQRRVMTVKVFILACLFPGPTMLVYFIARFSKINAKPKDNQDIQCLETIIFSGEEHEIVREETREQNRMGRNREEVEGIDDEVKGSEEEILHTLLRHYKPLNVCGVRFTWLGIHQMYRMVLVTCNIYITDPLTKLYVMTAVVMVTTVVNTIVRPYKDNKANVTATLSYTTSICIAIINISKVVITAFGCETNCSFRHTLMWYLSKCEYVLLVYVPMVAVGVWFPCVVLQKCIKNVKKKKGSPK